MHLKMVRLAKGKNIERVKNKASKSWYHNKGIRPTGFTSPFVKEQAIKSWAP